MSVKFLGIVAAAVVFAGSLVSKAEATTFDIDYTANNVTFDLVANATLDTATNAYDITSLTGSVLSGSNTYSVTGLVGSAGTVQTSGVFTFDNTLTDVNGTWELTSNGLLFTAGPGNLDYNLFSDTFFGSPNNALLSTDPALGSFASTEELLGSGTVSAVPEASTWVMMILGFVGLGALGYRRSVRSVRLA
jgi:hypothetical protein